MRDWLSFVGILVYYSTATSAENFDEAIVQKILTEINQAQRFSRPSQEGNQTVNVQFGLELLHIMDFDEKNQILTTLTWKELIWKDYRLSWNPEEFGGVKSVNIPSSIVWTPEIDLYNSFEIRHSQDLAFSLVLKHDGTCTWMPTSVYRSFCEVNMENFPYDRQNCSLKFGPWAANENQVNLTILHNREGLGLSEYIASMEWDLSNSKVKRNSKSYECCAENFIDITYYFILARNSSFYAQFLILPVILLSLMVMVIFWIPPTRPDRTSLGMGLLSSFMLLLLLVAQLAPPSKSIKLITYCGCNIILIAAAIVLSTIVANICQRNKPFSCGSKCLKRSNSKPQQKNPIVTEDCEAKISELRKPPQFRTQWTRNALLLDRICFIVYALLTVVIAALYFPRPI